MLTQKQRIINNVIKEAIAPPPDFDKEAFFGRWFVSNKKKIPKSWYEYLAKVYPYSGRAFRLDTKPYGAPYTSWCRTVDGLTEWKASMEGNILALTPRGFYNYRGTITKGINLAEFVKDTGVGYDSGKLIIKIEEVCPIVPVISIMEI